MTPYVQDSDFTLYVGDALNVLRELEDASVDCVVTSPPYLDARPEYDSPTSGEFAMIFCELARVVTGGMLWNVGRVWRNGVELTWWHELIECAAESGWQLWDTAVWIKPNANPIQGRVLTNSHEYVLVLGRPGVEFNTDALRTEYAPASISRLSRKWINGRGVKLDPPLEHDHRIPANELGARATSYLVCDVGREKGNLHPAPMALGIAEELVSLASWPGQTVLDPFLGSGTTAVAARKHGRNTIGIELSPEYAALAAGRLQQLSLLS